MADCLFLITTRDKKEALKIGQKLVKEKLASCINACGGFQSLYWWKGKIEKAKEGVLFVKTKKNLKGKVIRRIKELHSYDSPCIIVLPCEIYE